MTQPQLPPAGWYIKGYFGNCMIIGRGQRRKLVDQETGKQAGPEYIVPPPARRYYHMKLTRKKSVDISIELWTWLAETGEEWKSDWPGWENLPKMEFQCPFCEYSTSHGDRDCEKCPHYKAFGYCDEVGTPFGLWAAAEPEDTEGRKFHAAAFLAQLRQLQVTT